jgi:hypothetical protein
MAPKKPSRPITPTGQGHIALIPLYQRLQQAGYTRHAACAMLEWLRASRTIQITPQLPEGRLIPRGEGLALKTANGIRGVARVYLRVRSPKKSTPPMPWRPEWHALREVVLRAPTTPPTPRRQRGTDHSISAGMVMIGMAAGPTR